MRLSIRAHYDGKTIVPDEPVDVPVNRPLEVELSVIDDPLTPGSVEERLAALARFTARGSRGANIPLESLRRENLYEDR